MKLIPLCTFSDNYIWLIHENGQAIVVDPGDSMPVFQVLRALQLDLVSIFITHEHHDHTAGVVSLVKETGAQVYAPKHSKFPFLCQRVGEGDSVPFFGEVANVMEIPGHTQSHIGFFVDRLVALANEGPVLFCGDTLFSVGCGRLFDGTAHQLERSLLRLAALPADTLVYCAHEYTQQNIQFALKVDPGNLDLLKYAKQVDALRAKNLATIPSTIGLERLVNPFLRTRQDAIQSAVFNYNGKLTANIGVFAVLRKWKNEG